MADITNDWVSDFNARQTARNEDLDRNESGYRHREFKNKGAQGERASMSDRVVRACRTNRPAGRG